MRVSKISLQNHSDTVINEYDEEISPKKRQKIIYELRLI